MAADADPDTVEAITSWAHEVGMVFQLADDVLDLVSTTEEIGKPAGSDIHEGKFTMPLLLALDGPEGDRIRKLLSEERPYRQETRRRGDRTRCGRATTSTLATLAEAHRRLDSGGRCSRPYPVEAPGRAEARGVLDGPGRYLVTRIDAAAPEPTPTRTRGRPTTFSRPDRPIHHAMDELQQFFRDAVVDQIRTLEGLADRGPIGKRRPRRSPAPAPSPTA
jgi:hypothetical protein